MFHQIRSLDESQSKSVIWIFAPKMFEIKVARFARNVSSKMRLFERFCFKTFEVDFNWTKGYFPLMKRKISTCQIYISQGWGVPHDPMYKYIFSWLSSRFFYKAMLVKNKHSSVEGGMGHGHRKCKKKFAANNSRYVRSSAGVVMCRSFLWPEKRNPDPLTSVLLRFSPFRGFIIFTSRLLRCFAQKKWENDEAIDSYICLEKRCTFLHVLTN